MDSKKIVYVDMDNVLVDFESGIRKTPGELIEQYEGRVDDVPGIFAAMDPMAGAIESFGELSALFDTYILSTAPWENPSAWSDKLLWVKAHLGSFAYKRLVLSHHKNLNRGDFLIDDRTKHGAGEFVGEHILFGSERYPDWATVMRYLRDVAQGSDSGAPGDNRRGQLAATSPEQTAKARAEGKAFADELAK